MRPKPPSSRNKSSKPDKAKKPTNIKKRERPKTDVAHLSSPIDTSIRGFSDLIKLFQSSTPEVCDALDNECELLYECKICRSMFRSITNFVTHKRAYCSQKFRDKSNNRNGQIKEQSLVLSKKRGSTLTTRTTMRKDILTLLDRIRSEVIVEKDVTGPLILREMAQTDECLLNSFNQEGKAPTLERTATLGPDGRVVGAKTPEPEVFTCPHCNKELPSQKSLSVHTRSEHSDLRTCFVCPSCKKYFANTWSVYRHMYKVHRKSREQVRKLRNQIQKKLLTVDELNRLKKCPELNDSNNSEEPISDISGGEKTWMEELEGHTELSRCLNCGKKFDRRVAMMTHLQTCQRNLSLQLEPGKRTCPSPSELSSSSMCQHIDKKSRIEVRMDYEKSNSTPKLSEYVLNGLTQPRVILTKTELSPSFERLWPSQVERTYSSPTYTMSSATQTNFSPVRANSSPKSQLSPKGEEIINDIVSRYSNFKESPNSFANKSLKLESKVQQLHNNLVDIEEVNKSDDESIVSTDSIGSRQSRVAEGNGVEKLKGSEVSYYSYSISDESEDELDQKQWQGSQKSTIVKSNGIDQEDIESSSSCEDNKNEKDTSEDEMSIPEENMDNTDKLEVNEAEIKQESDNRIQMRSMTNSNDNRKSAEEEVILIDNEDNEVEEDQSDEEDQDLEMDSESDMEYDEDVLEPESTTVNDDVANVRPGTSDSNSQEDINEFISSNKISSFTNGIHNVESPISSNEQGTDDEVVSTTLNKDNYNLILRKINSYVDKTKRKCLLCLKTFPNLMYIRRHIAMHFNINHFKCGYNNCNFKCYLKRDIACHVRRHKIRALEIQKYIQRLEPKADFSDRSYVLEVTWSPKFGALPNHNNCDMDLISSSSKNTLDSDEDGLGLKKKKSPSFCPTRINPYDADLDDIVISENSNDDKLKSLMMEVIFGRTSASNEEILQSIEF